MAYSTTTPPPLRTVPYVSFGMLFPIHRRSCAERAHTRRDDLFGTMGGKMHIVFHYMPGSQRYTYTVSFCLTFVC